MTITEMTPVISVLPSQGNDNNHGWVIYSVPVCRTPHYPSQRGNRTREQPHQRREPRKGEPREQPNQTNRRTPEYRHQSHRKCKKDIEKGIYMLTWTHLTTAEPGHKFRGERHVTHVRVPKTVNQHRSKSHRRKPCTPEF